MKRVFNFIHAVILLRSIESLNDEFNELAQDGKYAEILEKIRLSPGLDQLYSIYWSLFSYRNMGKVKDGLNYYSINQKIIKNADDATLKPRIWNIVGDLYYKNGQSLTAYQFFQKAFEKAITLNQKDQITIALNYLGAVNMTRGNLSMSLEYFEKCYNQAQEKNDLLLLSSTCYNIGNIHFLTKDFVKSKEYFLKSLDLAKSISNQTEIALVLKSLIELELEVGPNIELVDEYLNDLREIANKKNTDRTTLYYLFSKANVSKWRNEKNKAELIYRRIIDENKESEITFNSILALIEILFLRYRESQKPDILSKIHDLLDLMLSIAKQQYSFRYLVKSLILKSQLHAIEGDFEESFLLIEKALKSTEGDKMEYLQNEIIRLKDKLSTEYEKLKLLFEEQSSLLSRLNESSIMELLRE